MIPSLFNAVLTVSVFCGLGVIFTFPIGLTRLAGWLFVACAASAVLASALWAHL